MSNVTARRGRPKGSGLDDRVRLRTVAALLASNPELKTTTAIKSTGVSDPSTIRRLRDKFHECRDQLMAELGDAEPRMKAAQPAEEVAAVHAIDTHEPRAMSAATKLPASVPTIATAAGELPAPRSWATSAFDANPWLAAWCAIQIKAASTVLDAQLGLINHMMKLPHVSLAMRQQIALNDMTFAFCAPPRVRHLLH